jgi:hypothetical protein
MAVVQSGSKSFSVNFVPSGASTSADIFIEFAAVFLDAGWIAVDWSDGSSVTTSAVPATFAQLDNSNAWQRFRAPSGSFEIEWQRGTSDWIWRCFFDADGFNNDGVAATMPTASGTAFQIIGTAGGFDSGGWGWASTGASSYRWAMCADSVPGQAGAYYFHMFARRDGTGVAHRRFFFSPLETGSFPVEDVAPWIATGETAIAALNASTLWQSFYLKGFGGEAKAIALVADSQQDFPNGGVPNPYNAKIDFARIFARDTTAPEEQIKGSALDLFWPLVVTGVVPNSDTINLTTVWGAGAGADPGAVIRYEDLLVPWAHGVAPVI